MSSYRDYGYEGRGRDDRRGNDGRQGSDGRRGNDDHRGRDDRRNDRQDGRDRQVSGNFGRQRSRSPGNRAGDYRKGSGNASIATSLPPLPLTALFPEATGATIPYTKHSTKGTRGKRAVIKSLLLPPSPALNSARYELRFTVPESSQHRGSEVVSATQLARVLVHASVVSFLGPNFVFDGTMGWSPTELMPVGKSLSTTIPLGSRRDGKPNDVEVVVRNSGPLDIRGLVNYLKAGRIDLNPTGNPGLENGFKWLNAVFRDDPARRMVSRPGSSAHFQRSRETSMALASTGGVLEAIRGIYQSVQLRFSALSVCVDTTTSAFWTPDRALIDCICALAGERAPQNLEKSFSSNPGFFLQACGMLLGSYFKVRHLSTDGNLKRMKFVSWSAADAYATIFDECLEDGTSHSISVADYFLRKYKHKILYPNLPLAHTASAGDIPLEMCYTAPGERYKGVLQGKETADFIKFSTTSATIRREQIDANLRNLAWHQNPTVKAHGLSVDPKMLQVNATVLDAPELQYGSSRISPRDGSWNLRGLQFLRPATITSWALLSFSRQVNTLEILGQEIIQSFRSVGMQCPSQPPSVLFGNPQGDMQSIFRNVIMKAEKEFRRAPDLIIILLEESSIPIYHAIKQALDVVHGIASQVMLGTKVFKSRGLPQYLANISMKVNVKLGGTNCMVRQDRFQKGRWMLIGGDISSASPSALKRDPPPPTTAALCATLDSDCTAYTGIATMQPSTASNTIVQARLMFKELLIRYKEKNSSLPEHIIYFRDGASESEFDAIRDNEGRELRQLCKDSGTKITIIVAIKRHHTRFFAECPLATKLGNVPPGTIVENSSQKNDSFIIAHKDLMGTKRPTRYISLVDENKLSADEFHSIIYESSFTYARATTSVAVVPPIYYAHQLCERARLHLQDTPDGNQFLPQVHGSLKWNMYWQ